MKNLTDTYFDVNTDLNIKTGTVVHHSVNLNLSMIFNNIYLLLIIKFMSIKAKIYGSFDTRDK